MKTGRAHDAFLPGSQGCECPKCHRLFSKEYAFEAHLKGPPGAKICLDPKEIGLTSKTNPQVYEVWARRARDGQLRAAYATIPPDPLPSYQYGE